MTELRRWIDETGALDSGGDGSGDDRDDDFIRDLLRSADDDVPDPDARDRTLAMLAAGVGVGAGAGAMVAKKAGAAGGWKLFGLAAWKWLATIAIAVVLGVVAMALRSPPKESPPASPSPVGVAPAVTATSAPANQTGAASGPAGADDPAGILPSPAVTAASGAAPKAVAKPAPSASAAPALGLAEELAMLDQARGALAKGDPAGALVILDKYDREAKTRALGPEATMVRIEALHARGNDAAARALARRFLAANPGSAYEDRVRTLVGETREGAKP